MLISEAIAKIKEQLKLKDQYEVARTLGISQATVSNYMKGKSYPTLSVATKIYGEYGYRVEPFTESALKKEWEFYTKHGLNK